MPRKPKWMNKPEMWKYCAKLVNGGASYSDVRTKLSLAENRKRFGLVEVPGEDTIRTRLNSLNLLDANVPGTVLMPDDLQEHHRGLVYLALGIRDKAALPKPTRTNPVAPGVREWHGFAKGPLLDQEPDSPEEREVDNAWSLSVSDPREIFHYPYLVEHMKFTRRGKSVMASISAVVDLAANHMELVANLRAAVLEKMSVESSFSDANEGSRAQAADAVMRTLQPTVRRSKGTRTIGGVSRELRATSIKIMENLRGGDKHTQLVESWAASSRTAGSLRKALTPRSLVQRLILEGTCNICAIDSEYKRLDVNPDPAPVDGPARRTRTDDWPGRGMTGLPDLSE